jgi:hypothetical protein
MPFVPDYELSTVISAVFLLSMRRSAGYGECFFVFLFSIQRPKYHRWQDRGGTVSENLALRLIRFNQPLGGSRLAVS